MKDNTNYSKLRNLSAVVITYIAALIPIFKSCPPCPVCMPHYAALFSLFGLKLADYSNYLIPIMLTGMGATLSSMYYQIQSKKLNTYPLYVALVSCTALIIGKFILDNNWAVYPALIGLFLSTTAHHYTMKKTCCNATTACTD